MSVLRAGSLNTPAADTAKASESQPIHLTIGSVHISICHAPWRIARRIDIFLDEGHIRGRSALFPQWTAKLALTPPRHCQNAGFKLADGFTVNASFRIGAHR
jgi:hypothetical protein